MQKLVEKDLRDNFLLYASVIHRDGIKNLLDYLDEVDFYYAPCSTRFHLCEPHGLLAHSCSVYEIGRKLFASFTDCTAESVAIMTLFHDICKCETYEPVKKSRKTGRNLPNGKPEWEDYTGYDVVEAFPFGHGEKSVYILNKFINLKDNEAMAIRWHMAFSDPSFKGGSYSLTNAMEKYPEIAVLHSADLISTSRGL